MSKIGLVVPVLWHEGFTDLMLSIRTKHDYKIYVEPQYLFKKVLSQAWNHGMDRAFADGCEYALVCNDDIMFAPCAIDALVECYEQERHNNVVMVTANNVTNELGGDKYKILNFEVGEVTFTVADHPNFSCFLVTKDYIEKVGYFDEGFNPAWYEDNDSHRRAILAGVREIVTTSAPTWHGHSKATGLLAVTNGPQSVNSEQSRIHYVQKWGGLPGGEVYANPYNDPTKTVKDW